jgi:hypothetical protein
MPQVRFEPTIPVFQRAKTVHAIDRAATVIGKNVLYILTAATGRLEYVHNSPTKTYGTRKNHKEKHQTDFLLELSFST